MECGSLDTIRYGIAGGLNRGHLDRIHRTALAVLEAVGVEVENPELLAKVSEADGVQVDGTRVYFDPDLVNRYVDQYRARARAGAESDEFVINILNGYAFQFLDPFTDWLRPMNTAECIESAKLVDTLYDSGVRGSTPGLPQDVPLELREIMAYKIGCEYSRSAGEVGFTSLGSADYVYRMSQAVGKPFSLSIFVLSPLRVAGAGLEMALDFIDRDINVPVGFTGMPLRGLTAPFSLAGAFVENIATTLAAFTMFKVMGVPNDLHLHFDVYPFDMKFGAVAYGTPDHVHMYLMGTQINHYYGVADTTCKAFHTNAVFPDAHSIAQRASFAALAAANGARTFTFGGMLGIDKIFSPEQLIIDVEVVDHVRQMVKGIDLGDESFGFDALKEVGPGGTFVTHPTTLGRYRELYVSDLFENVAPEKWAAEARPTVKERIRDRVKTLLAGYDFHLESHVKKELDDLYAAAARELA